MAPLPKGQADDERVTSVRELARRIGISHVAILKAERVKRISREADGSWDVERVRRELIASAAPGRSPLAACRSEMSCDTRYSG